MIRARFFRSAVAAAATLTVLSGCNLFGHRHDDHADVHTMRLTFSATGAADQVLNITGAAGENRSVTLGTGTTVVTAVWLSADGTPDTDANTSEYRLRVVPPAGSGVTWQLSATSNHAGTLTIPGAVTNVQVQFALEHIAENHDDFGPIPVTVTAQ